MADIQVTKNPNGDSRSNPNPTLQQTTERLLVEGNLSVVMYFEEN